jgi:hypothetical protein
VVECQCCRFRDYGADMNPACAECWTRYFVAVIRGVGKFGADSEKVADRVFEELAKDRSST